MRPCGGRLCFFVSEYLAVSLGHGAFSLPRASTTHPGEGCAWECRRWLIGGANGTSNRKFSRSSLTHIGTSLLHPWCWHEQDPAVATLRMPAQLTRMPLRVLGSKLQEGEKAASKPFVGTACVQTCEDRRKEGKRDKTYEEK